MGKHVHQSRSGLSPAYAGAASSSASARHGKWSESGSPRCDTKMTDATMTQTTRLHTPPQVPHIVHSARPSTVSTALSGVSSPSSFRRSVDMIGSVARPVGSAAVSLSVGMFHACVGAVSFGVGHARRLRNEWQEAQHARRTVNDLRAKYAAEKLAAKQRERAAMQRLKQLEEQLRDMQEQLNLAPTSDCAVPAAPPMGPPAPALVPVAPPMTVAAGVPSAPPMAPAMSAAPAPAKPTHAAAPAVPSKPDAASLLAAARQLRSVQSSGAVAKAASSNSTASVPTAAVAATAAAAAASSSSGGIDLAMLSQVKLKSVANTASSSVRARRTSSSTFLFDALHARFQRSQGAALAASRAAAALPSRPSFGGVAVHQTPASTRHAGAAHHSSAFSPMTPHEEEPWTPAV